ncbi:hypothetical protein SNEBB_008076 [Seison nebaliae]|nr:hypothetical protein SNEBB_008076 [Seison nebaliae]
MEFIDSSLVFDKPDKTGPKHARSVHLWWKTSGQADVYYNEIQPTHVDTGTYYCALGFSGGYGGAQQSRNGNRILIFSVWDPGNQDDPNSVSEDQKVKVLYGHPQAEVSRFGNEGTGAKCKMPWHWNENEKIPMLVHAQQGEEGMRYTGYAYNIYDQQWVCLAQYESKVNNKLMTGLYSFVEDFKRNYRSVGEIRAAYFGPVWTRVNGQWEEVDTCTFSADNTPLNNINATTSECGTCFHLCTGGNTEQQCQLREKLTKGNLSEQIPPHLQLWEQQYGGNLVPM